MHTSYEHKQNETNTYSDNILEYLNSQLIRQCFTYDNLEVIKYLLKQGADINAYDTSEDDGNDYHHFGYTPLISAIKQNRNFATIKYLVEHGAHVNVPDDIGITPLNVAVRKSDMELIKYLIDNGAKVTKRDIKLALSKDNNTTIIDYLQSF